MDALVAADAGMPLLLKLLWSACAQVLERTPAQL
jgi:hypothetical protein